MMFDTGQQRRIENLAASYRPKHIIFLTEATKLRSVMLNRAWLLSVRELYRPFVLLFKNEITVLYYLGNYLGLMGKNVRL